MPPSLPRPSTLNGLSAALSSCRISAPATVISKKPTRPAIASLSTSSAARNPQQQQQQQQQQAAPIVFPPQSPRFITLPEPPQSSEIKLGPIKGHLPVPRDIFPKRDGDRKIQPEYIANATKLSKAELAGLPPKTEHEERRRRMAAARRKALEEGLRGLYERKQLREKRWAARSKRNYERNLAAAMAPERLDEVLTRSTVLEATALGGHLEEDPHRFARAKKAAKKHAAIMAKKAEARRDALAQLYVAAQNFIVDEKELEQRVEELFKPDTFRYGGSGNCESIWDTQKAPVSISELRADTFGTSANIIDAKKSNSVKTAARQKIVAEELTGGKL